MLIQTTKFIKFVTQSEAKSLGSTHADVLEILRRYAPLDGIKLTINVEKERNLEKLSFFFSLQASP